MTTSSLPASMLAPPCPEGRASRCSDCLARTLPAGTVPADRLRHRRARTAEADRAPGRRVLDRPEEEAPRPRRPAPRRSAALQPARRRSRSTPHDRFARPEALPLDRWVAYRVRHHEVLRWLEVVALAGADPPASVPAGRHTPPRGGAARPCPTRRRLSSWFAPAPASPAAADRRRFDGWQDRPGDQRTNTARRTLAARVVDSSRRGHVRPERTLDLAAHRVPGARCPRPRNNTAAPRRRAVGSPPSDLHIDLVPPHRCTPTVTPSRFRETRLPTCGADLEI